MKNENQDESRKNTIAGISSGDVFVSGVEKTMNSKKKIPSGILEKAEEKRRELSGLQKSNPDQEWITRRNQELRNREELNKERIRFLNPESVKFCPCVFHADSNVVFCRIFRRFLF